MTNLSKNNVQIIYKNEHLMENFHQAETQILSSWMEEILAEVATEKEVIERKLN